MWNRRYGIEGKDSGETNRIVVKNKIVTEEEQGRIRGSRFSNHRDSKSKIEDEFRGMRRCNAREGTRLCKKTEG